jgi:hypothetical protein
MNPRWPGERREFLQEAVREGVCSNDHHDGNCWWRGLAGRRKLSDPVEKVVIHTVDEESKVRQEVHADDGYLYICHHKSPSELAAQCKVQAP